MSPRAFNATDTSVDFQCNICGGRTCAPLSKLTREEPTCPTCGSTVRMRGVIHVLTTELFGKSLAIDDIPLNADISGIGLSDWNEYADRLAKKFDYTNTFYHKEPRLDINQLGANVARRCDFLISTDVFEHVAPPISTAFANAFKLLNPGGLFILTVPYTLEGATVEHFPNLHSYEIVEEAGNRRLKNMTIDGKLEIFDDLCFHGGDGSTLEMRYFSESGLLAALEVAGFIEVKIHREAEPGFGIYWPIQSSLPITLRKPGRFIVASAKPVALPAISVPRQLQEMSDAASARDTDTGYCEERTPEEMSSVSEQPATSSAQKDTGRVHTKMAAFTFAMQVYSSYLAAKMPNFDLDAYVVRRSLAASRPLRLLSLASGTGENEIAVAAKTNGMIEVSLIEESSELLDRAAEIARRAGVSVSTHVCDVEAIAIAPKAFDFITCRSAVHRFHGLERIFEQVKGGLADGGEFLVIGEPIGRNGLRLYPETRSEAQKIFNCLPERLHRNGYNGEIDELLPDIDISAQPLEAVRSEDILPLLLSSFTPVEYVAYDAFVSLLLDFRYGPNYDVSDEHDRAVVDFIVHRDIDIIQRGILKPTSLFGIFR